MLSIVINTRNRKEMLYALLASLYKSDFADTDEIIVVDDCSDEDYSNQLKENYPKVIFIRNSSREYLIKSRNKGWKSAKGDYVFFIDDDNEINDDTFFSKALGILEKDPTIGILGCRTYYFAYPSMIMVGPTRFNKTTGKTLFRGINKNDFDEIKGLIETHDNPNAFFTTKKVLEKTGGFTEEIVQTFSEADFAEKVRKLGLKVFQYSELKVYHKSMPATNASLTPRQLGGSPERFYYLMRNRFVFIKKWGNFGEKLLFTLVFSHLYTFYYLYIPLKFKETTMVKKGLRGVLDGYIYMLTGTLRNQ